MSDTNMIYDDRNTNFMYQPDVWFAGTWNASNVGQSGTLHTSNDPTANVTFTFPVAAIGFFYYGIKRSQGGLYGICIDCTPGAPNFIHVDAFNATDDGHNPPVPLYNWTFPTLGVHEIIIQNMPDPRGNPINNSEITIDRIELILPGTTSIITTTLTDITSTPIPSTTTTTSAFVQPSKSAPASPLSPSPPVGAIVGGVIGALALLIGITFFFLYRRRLHRPRVREEGLRAHSAPFRDPPISHITQFRDEPQLSRPGATSSTANSRGGYGHFFFSGDEKEDTAPRNKSQWTMPSVASTTASTQMPSSSSVTTSRSATGVGSSAIVPALGLPRRELDAGPLPVPVEEEEETLPPDYGQVFAPQP